jgi:hypothetical protein
MNLPQGYIPHAGEGCPVDGDQFVDCIIRTSEGLGHSGAIRARYHDWAQDVPGGLGHIVGYRIAAANETIDLHQRWPEMARRR